MSCCDQTGGTRETFPPPPSKPSVSGPWHSAHGKFGICRLPTGSDRSGGRSNGRVPRRLLDHSHPAFGPILVPQFSQGTRKRGAILLHVLGRLRLPDKGTLVLLTQRRLFTDLKGLGVFGGIFRLKKKSAVRTSCWGAQPARQTAAKRIERGAAVLMVNLQ